MTKAKKNNPGSNDSGDAVLADLNNERHSDEGASKSNEARQKEQAQQPKRKSSNDGDDAVLADLNNPRGTGGDKSA